MYIQCTMYKLYTSALLYLHFNLYNSGHLISNLHAIYIFIIYFLLQTFSAATPALSFQ